MELKSVEKFLPHITLLPLIEPYGIEISAKLIQLGLDICPLIEPYGIEMTLSKSKMSKNLCPLIEPYGIEIVFIR